MGGNTVSQRQVTVTAESGTANGYEPCPEQAGPKVGGAASQISSTNPPGKGSTVIDGSKVVGRKFETMEMGWEEDFGAG